MAWTDIAGANTATNAPGSEVTVMDCSATADFDIISSFVPYAFEDTSPGAMTNPIYLDQIRAEGGGGGGGGGGSTRPSTGMIFPRGQ